MPKPKEHSLNQQSKIARLIAVVFAILFPTLVTWVYFHVLSDSAPKLQQAAYGIGKCLQFAFPVAFVWLWLKIIPHKFALPDFEGSKRWTLATSIGFGVAVGLGVAGLIYVIYGSLFPDTVLESLQVEIADRVAAFSVDSAQKFFALALFYAVVHAFMEEYYFRWFVFGQLRHLVSFWPAAIISGLAFMAHHVIVIAHYFGGINGWTILLSASIAVGGVIWAWQYEKSKSLIGPWVSHAIVDAGIFIVGYDLLKDTLA